MVERQDCVRCWIRDINAEFFLSGDGMRCIVGSTSEGMLKMHDPVVSLRVFFFGIFLAFSMGGEGYDCFLALIGVLP